MRQEDIREWKHPFRLSRDELDEIVAREIKNRGMIAVGKCQYVDNAGGFVDVDGVDVCVRVRPVDGNDGVAAKKAGE